MTIDLLSRPRNSMPHQYETDDTRGLAIPCHTNMKRMIQGLLWLFLLEFSLMVMSLEPGFLDFDNLPDTNFSCVGKVIGGYYADLETNCQMFHVCTIGQLDEPMDIRFLCLNGTVFDQETRVCERIDEVDCTKSEQFYSLNLELYGNTQPPILEESPEVEYPLDSKKFSTTVPPPTSTLTSTFAPFFTSSTTPTSNRDISKVITSHHFPVNAPDIRFNPEEINISLKAGAPPDITRSQVPISYQQQSFSEKNTRVTVTTHTTIYKNDKPHRVPLLSTTNPPLHPLLEKSETTLTPKSVVSYGLTHNQGSAVATPTEINYGFSYPQNDESVEYHTDVPPHPYQYQLNIGNFRPPTAQGHPYHSSYRTAHKRQHKVNFPATTYRNHPAFTSSAKTPQQQRYQLQTEKPPNLQLPLPLLPTLQPLTFSSPSPFSLGHHIETKRYTKDHPSPPRIIISASASVSDNNGRRLNYSLGTIGASHFLGSSPASYDDYKEEDVILDPFYLDVPKLKKLRRKRSNHHNDDDVIRNDQEAEDLLRYLFNWYKDRENLKHVSIPVPAEDITNINDQLAPITDTEAARTSEIDYANVFRKILKEDKTEHTQYAGNLGNRSDEEHQPNYEQDRDTTEYRTTEQLKNKESMRRLMRRTNTSSYNSATNNITDDYHIHSHREVHLQLTEKNHTRRSGLISPAKKQQNNISDNQVYKHPEELFYETNKKEIQLETDDLNQETNLEELKSTLEPLHDDNTTDLENLSYDDYDQLFNNTTEIYDENEQELINSTTMLPRDLITENHSESALVTTLNYNVKEETKVTNGDYDYIDSEDENVYDYIIPTTEVDTETNNTDVTTESTLINRTESVFEDLNYDTTTLNLSDLDSITTTASNLETNYSDNVNTTEITDIEMLVLESQSLSHKNYDPVDSLTKLKNIHLENKGISKTKQSDYSPQNAKTPNSNGKKIIEETPVEVFPDYVDDNYEPLTYQIRPEVNETKEVKITTEATSTTTDFTDAKFTTEFDKLVSIDIPQNVTEDITTTLLTTDVPTALFTTQTSELTTAPTTSFPTVTAENTETTILTEGVIQTSTTEFLTSSELPTITTENYPSVNTNPLSTSTVGFTESGIITSNAPRAAKSSTSSTYKKESIQSRKEFLRHRFSTANRQRGRGQSKFEKESLPVLTTFSNSSMDKQEFPLNTSNGIAKLDDDKVRPKINDSLEESSQLDTTTIATDTEVELSHEIKTDAPLLRSVNPTKAKYTKIVLSTTPLTKVVRVELRKDMHYRRYVFNCFNKKVHRFYADPRDCRLFHYCTLGYTKNQLVDMKFVCDLGTYYNEDKFICTKVKPARCS